MIFDKDYAKYYDMFNRDKDYGKEVRFLDKVFKKYSQVSNVLDIGCGTGIHSEKMVEMGYFVTGIDISEEMIDIAKSKKIKQTNFSVDDMTNFDLDKKFDACTIMFAVIGYLTKNEEIENSLDCVKKHLKKGGLLVFDCWNGLGVMRDLPTSRIKKTHANGIDIKRISYPSMDPLNQKCDVIFDVEISKEGKLMKKFEENHSVRFFFPQELRKYLEDAGFEVLKICKSFEFEENLDETCWNMSIIARLKKDII